MEEIADKLKAENEDEDKLLYLPLYFNGWKKDHTKRVINDFYTTA